MKTRFNSLKNLWLPLFVAICVLLLAGYACTETSTDGGNYEEKAELPFRGLMGFEDISLTPMGEKKTVFDGLVTLSIGTGDPNRPVSVSVATFPMYSEKFDGYNISNQGFHLSFDSRDHSIMLTIQYDKILNEHKGTLDHFNEENLTIYKISAEDLPEEPLLAIEPCSVNKENNTIRGFVMESGTYIVGEK